jgi:hypothetical protein
MIEPLQAMEQKRSRLFEQLQSLGDFRPGMISVNYRKCGKPNCVCARPGHPGHGPQYLWNTTQQSKSRAQSLRLGPELKKSQEVERHCRFLALCRELVEVNEQICQLRPVAPIQDAKELELMGKNCRRSTAGDRARNRAFARPSVGL